MIIGYFDYLVIGILIFLNIKFWKKEISGKTGCLVGGILFGFLIPLISLIIEVQRVKMTIGIMDSFEVLYTYLRFPTYWIIGIIQTVIIGVKLSLKKDDQEIENIGNE